jgi:capsid protein
METNATWLEAVQAAMAWIDRDEPEWLAFPGLTAGVYRSEAELAALRAESRWYAQYHPFALSALENRANYIVGSGHNYKVNPKPGVEIDAASLDAIQRELIEFVERSQWPVRQREIQWRMDRDGEAFLRMFVVDGRLEVRFVEPDQVTSPIGRPDIAFGVETDPEDAETVLAFWVARRPGQAQSLERIDASEIQHRKANVDRTMPRGVPILTSVRANLRRAWKLLRNMSTVAGIQAAVAIVRRHEAAAVGSIQQYVSRLATAQTRDDRGQTRDYQHLPPGAIVDLPPGVSYEFPASGIDASKFVQAVQAELRAIAARLCMPEFMLSADASNANYASTMVAEGPAVKMFERLQSEMIWADAAILTRALETAERAGRLPIGASRQVTIDAEAPIVQSRNRLAEAQADQILLAMGVISPQSVAARHGYDWRAERDLIAQAEEQS